MSSSSMSSPVTLILDIFLLCSRLLCLLLEEAFIGDSQSFRCRVDGVTALRGPSGSSSPVRVLQKRPGRNLVVRVGLRLVELEPICL